MADMRSQWSGSVSFGMVNVPVKLYTAASKKDVAFTTVHAVCGGQMKSPKMCPTCEITDVDGDEVLRAFKRGKSEFVQLTDADFEGVKLETTKTAEIVEFVDEAKVDRLYRLQGYIVGPVEAAAKPFQLLRTAMTQSGLVAICKIATSKKERLAVLRPYENGTMAMETLYWADEQKSADQLAVPDVSLSEKEVALAKQLVDAMTVDEFDASQYHDEYRAALLEMIEAKAGGEEVAPYVSVAKPPAEDLMAALSASVAAVKKAA